MLRLPIDHISQIGDFCFCYQNRFFRNLQITIRAQISSIRSQIKYGVENAGSMISAFSV